VNGLFTVAGLPAHPLLVDAVAVLLPLAAVCSVGLAVHRGVRRRFGWPVLVLTAVAVRDADFSTGSTSLRSETRPGDHDAVGARPVRVPCPNNQGAASSASPGPVRRQSSDAVSADRRSTTSQLGRAAVYADDGASGEGATRGSTPRATAIG